MTKAYIKYHIRWQVSSIVMLLIMWPLEHWLDLPIVFNLPIGQFFGALVFWRIDNWIIKGGDI
jgi:hypothetical protein